MCECKNREECVQGSHAHRSQVWVGSVWQGCEGGLSDFTEYSVFGYFYNKVYLGKVRNLFVTVDTNGQWGSQRSQEICGASPCPQEGSGRMCAPCPDHAPWWEDSLNVLSLEAHLPRDARSHKLPNTLMAHLFHPFHHPVSLMPPAEALLHVPPWLLTNIQPSSVLCTFCSHKAPDTNIHTAFIHNCQKPEIIQRSCH